jgi:hypothetical protein
MIAFLRAAKGMPLADTIFMTVSTDCAALADRSLDLMVL